jgi:hypothetical protein
MIVIVLFIGAIVLFIGASAIMAEAISGAGQPSAEQVAAKQKRDERFAEELLKLPAHQTTATERINAKIIMDEKREREREQRQPARRWANLW